MTGSKTRYNEHHTARSFRGGDPTARFFYGTANEPALVYVYIPGTVTVIEDGAFAGCPNAVLDVQG